METPIDLTQFLPADAPAAMTEQAIQAKIEADGQPAVVTGVRIVITDDGQPAVQFVLLAGAGQEVTAIPTNAGAYLSPLNAAYVGKKATVVQENGVASFLSITDETATIG